MPLFKQEKSKVPSNLLKDRYGWPPFSILNTISWDWQRRKDDWEVLFKDSTCGRDVKRYNANPTNTFSARSSDAKTPESISEFDPYLTELMYRWFSKEGMKVLDPFAGGCVRGVVAAVLGRDYTGIDLSKDQVDTNRGQFNDIFNRYTNILGNSTWINADSEQFLTQDTNKYDMIFTCPPYYNLEKYTNHPQDLSNLSTYEDFLNKYRNILKLAVDRLKEDSFLVIVVSEIRADSRDISNSYYRGFVADTTKILQEDCNIMFYNDIILENNIGSLPIRAPKYFNKTRKIGRHHQNILVFYKGNICNIEDKYREVM